MLTLRTGRVQTVWGEVYKWGVGGGPPTTGLRGQEPGIDTLHPFHHPHVASDTFHFRVRQTGIQHHTLDAEHFVVSKHVSVDGGGGLTALHRRILPEMGFTCTCSTSYSCCATCWGLPRLRGQPTQACALASASACRVSIAANA